MQFDLINVNGYSLFINEMFDSAFPYQYVCRSQTISVKHQRSLLAWRIGLVDHACEITNEVCLEFNFKDPDLHDCRDKIEKMLKRKG